MPSVIAVVVERSGSLHVRDATGHWPDCVHSYLALPVAFELVSLQSPHLGTHCEEMSMHIPSYAVLEVERQATPFPLQLRKHLRTLVFPHWASLGHSLFVVQLPR